LFFDLTYLKSTGDYCEISQVDTNPIVYALFWTYCYGCGVLFFCVAVVSMVQFGLLVRFRGWKNVTKV
jgi:hypothetical protein